VRVKSTIRPSGFVSSEKTGRAIAWESELERDCHRLLEVDWKVRNYYDQPLELPLVYRDKEVRHFPDVKVEFKDGSTEIWEVKPKHIAELPEQQDIADWREAAISERYGWVYRVQTEEYIRAKPRFQNAQRILSARHAAIPENLLYAVADAFEPKPPTLGALESILHLPLTQRPSLWAMALAGHFDLDLVSTPLSNDTPIVSKFRFL
jgi:hypothetical protein